MATGIMDPEARPPKIEPLFCHRDIVEQIFTPDVPVGARVPDLANKNTRSQSNLNLIYFNPKWIN